MDRRYAIIRDINQPEVIESWMIPRTSKNPKAKVVGVGLESPESTCRAKDGYLINVVNLVDGVDYDSSTQYKPNIVYTFNPETLQLDGTYEVVDIPDEEQLSTAKAKKIAEIKASTISDAPVTITHPTYGDVTYNGGDVSAGAINGAITLAKMNGSAIIKLWDYKDKLRDYTELESLEIGKQIANDYKDVMEVRQTRITSVNEIEINDTYPTIEDAINAINLI